LKIENVASSVPFFSIFFPAAILNAQ